MKSRILSIFAIAIVLSSCSTAYRQAQTPDDVYFSPGKEKEKTYAAANDNRGPSNYERRNNNADYDDYTSSSDDQYLRMKTQNRYRWNALDDYDYWYSPSYAYNNYYGYNSFNPLMSNNWGLSLYYSPFASIQPYGWFNNYYPSYGYYTPYNNYYGHNNSYGYSPVFMTNISRANNNVHRPMLGSYANNGTGYNNSNNRSRNTGRYTPVFNGTDNRYSNSNNNRNNSSSNNNYNRPSSSTNSNPAPVRSFTPSSSGSSNSSGSSSGGGVTRQPRR